jgi:hypothetical protein
MTHWACREHRRLWIVQGMHRTNRPRAPQEWASRQLHGAERRGRPDRRNRLWWSVLYGSFHPRRRRPARRLDDSRFHSHDWYSSHLLAVAIGILLLCAADAFLTVTLLVNGADEINPVMAVLLYRSVAMFTAIKMGMTGAGTVLMVFLSRYRFMRVVPVQSVLYAVLVAYLALIGYEVWLLKGSIELPVL